MGARRGKVMSAYWFWIFFLLGGGGAGDVEWIRATLGMDGSLDID